jgi:hypothetical protein
LYEGKFNKKEELLLKGKILIYDGQEQSDPEFARHVEDSLGDFETTNLWSVDKLREKHEQKNISIEKLQNDLRQTKVIFREKVNVELAQLKQSYDQRIKQLEEKLRVSIQY